jgi:hypothetical protein
MSPRSAIERKNAVDRVRGALHSANTAMDATYHRDDAMILDADEAPASEGTDGGGRCCLT